MFASGMQFNPPDLRQAQCCLFSLPRIVLRKHFFKPYGLLFCAQICLLKANEDEGNFREILKFSSRGHEEEEEDRGTSVGLIIVDIDTVLFVFFLEHALRVSLKLVYMFENMKEKNLQAMFSVDGSERRKKGVKRAMSIISILPLKSYEYLSSFSMIVNFYGRGKAVEGSIRFTSAHLRW